MWLLEIRIAQLYCFSFGGDVHDSAPIVQYHKEIDDNEFVATDKFVGHASTLIRTAHERLAHAAQLERRHPSELAESQGGTFAADLASRARQLRAWFLDRASRASTSAASAWFAGAVLRLSLRPAEKELHERDEGEDGTELVVLKAYRPAYVYDSIVKRTESAVKAVILEQMPREAGDPEPLDLQLALHELTSLFLRSLAGAIEWSAHALFEDAETGALPLQALLRDRRPKLLRSFNAWQLYYDGSLYQYDSYLMSAAAWMLLLERHHAGRLSESARLETVTSEMFGAQKKSAESPAPEERVPKRIRAAEF